MAKTSIILSTLLQNLYSKIHQNKFAFWKEKKKEQNFKIQKIEKSFSPFSYFLNIARTNRIAMLC